MKEGGRKQKRKEKNVSGEFEIKTRGGLSRRKEKETKKEREKSVK